MKIEHRARPRGYFLLLLLFPALVLATNGCNGSYGGGGGGGNAPYITTQPTNQTVTAGQTATFSVVATGTAPLSYQWQKNGANISEATSSTYTTPTTTAADNGSTFDVMVSNSKGSVTSSSATLTVNASTGAPTITTQPANQTVTAGQTATFSVVATGTAPLSYQWQKNAANISGATSSSYTTPATTAADNGSTFDVMVSNSKGSVTSSSATLTVSASAGAPTITTQPANQTVTAGQTATFSVVATGTAPLSYQWQKNGANISGATSSSYTTPATTSSDNGSTFDVIVSNSAGSITSNTTTLTVNPSSGSKWPIKANGRYFVDATGAPWLMVGDSAHHIVNVLPMSSWPAYFQSRRSLGFNTVNIFSCAHGNCPPTGATADGQLPFTGMINSTCGTPRSDYDLSTPNPGYWAEIDSFINMAASYGLVVLIDPLTTADYMNDMRASSSKSGNIVNGFGSFLGNRYKNFPNIIWELGNDFQTWTSSAVTCPATTMTDNAIVGQLMAGIANSDLNHIQTIQLDYYRSFSNQDTALDPYLKADGFYTYYETYDYALKAYNSTPVTPVFLTESNMEAANNTGQLTCSGTATLDAHVLREQMYWTMTSGASGHVWGNTHVNHSDLTSPTWQSQLNTTATTQVAMLTNIFNQLQWWKLVPDMAHQVVTAGFGTPSANNENLCNSTYATAAWVPDSATPSLAGQAIVYTPVAAISTPLSVNMAMFSKPMNASWCDPTAGTCAPITGSPFANSGSHSFTTPSGHSDGTADWVLVLQ